MIDSRSVIRHGPFAMRTTAREGRTMDFLKSHFDRIQKQLAALNPSQKMLTMALVAIIAMTLVWWGRSPSDSGVKQ